MPKLAILHGCCKAPRCSAQIRGEGRSAAMHVGIEDPLLPYYTCTLNRLGAGAGHALTLPGDCVHGVDALASPQHDDSEYEQWLLDIEVESGQDAVGTERPWPRRLWQDVHVYLGHPDTRPPVWDQVMTDLPPDDYILVAHSLGSILAVDLLREGRTRPSALVTVGSPLSLPLITNWVPPLTLDVPWINIVDERDWVTLRRSYTPARQGFGGNPYQDVWVDNPEVDGDHDLIGYMSQPATIEAIEALLRRS